MNYGFLEYKFSDKKNVNTMLLYGLIFFTIVFSRDTLYTTVKFGFFTTFSLNVAMITFSYIYLIVRYRGKIQVMRKPTITVAMLIGILIIVSLIKLDFQMYIISIIFYILTALLFIHIYTFEGFFSKYSNIITFLAAYSIIICYIIRPIIFEIGTNSNLIGVITNSAELSFFDLGLGFIVSKSYYLRNFGIFREPGIYQFFLLIALFYELLFRKYRYRYFNAIVVALAILSTFSPPGILVMGIVIILHIIKLKRLEQINKNHIIVITATIVVGTIIFFYLYFNNSNFYDVVTQSIKKLFTHNDSSSTRIQSLTRNIGLFFNSPIWGNDFEVVQNGPIYNTNTTFSTLAMFGVFVGIMKLKLFYELSKKIDGKLDIVIATFFSFIVLINTQFLLGNSMFWILIFSSFMIEDNSNDDNQWDLEKWMKNLSKTVTGFIRK